VKDPALDVFEALIRGHHRAGGRLSDVDGAAFGLALFMHGTHFHFLVLL